MKFDRRPICWTAVTTIGKQRLRVAWTSAGVTFVDDASPNARRVMEKRMKMRLVDRPLPRTIRSALRKAVDHPGGDDVPIDLSWARDFERDVLLAARSIPWGETRPYSWLAREARRPLAIRAAASIIARDPLWLLVPWHRVVHKDGTTKRQDAFSKRKAALLARELTRRKRQSR
ncbi:MAG: methylated-DNA--[protein]-cysteine S-methyltransferase [Candidatus Eremiobacteraeota bacterium]|nr:methylated-DNA--[protein]-cysteine S-methyltransferase [Candidatus Eremiobacteraeota bacterium]